MFLKQVDILSSLFWVKYMDNLKPQCFILSSWNGLNERKKALHWSTRIPVCMCVWDLCTGIFFRYFAQTSLCIVWLFTGMQCYLERHVEEKGRRHWMIWWSRLDQIPDTSHQVLGHRGRENNIGVLWCWRRSVYGDHIDAQKGLKAEWL